MRFNVRFLVALVICGLLAAITGCGGSNLTSTSQAAAPAPAPSPSPSPTVSAVTASCTPASVMVGGISQCVAQVTDSTSSTSAVNWSASAGTITSSGQFTAPSTSGNVTITATSALDQTKSGQATVSVFAVPASKHVVMVMEENQSYLTVAGNKVGWPNLNNIIAGGGLPTSYFANTHPSIGNYFMLTTGQILTNDDNSTAVWNVDNIARRMMAAKVTFKVYAEGITQGYLGGNTGLYVIRHNPFAMLSDVAGDAAVANAVLCPFSQFAIDLAGNALPEFSFIVPDLNDDAHNGAPLQADTWLQSNIVTPLANNLAFKAGGDGLLVVAFDESIDTDITYGGGQVVAALWGPIVKAGFHQTSSTIYQHQSLLRTVMEALRLPNPPAAAAAAPLMSEFFVSK